MAKAAATDTNVAQSPDSGWQFRPDDTSQAAAPAPARSKSSASVQWTASEFIAHDKSSSWYISLGLVTIVAAALAYLLTKDKITTGMIIIVAILFGIIAARQPRELNYEVSDKGVQIGPKLYPYSAIRSFAIVQEGAIESIWLMPLKRFMPIISIYFDPKDAKKITNVLSQTLPLEDHQLDVVDKLMHRIRF